MLQGFHPDMHLSAPALTLGGCRGGCVVAGEREDGGTWRKHGCADDKDGQAADPDRGCRWLGAGAPAGARHGRPAMSSRQSSTSAILSESAGYTRKSYASDTALGAGHARHRQRALRCQVTMACQTTPHGSVRQYNVWQGRGAGYGRMAVQAALMVPSATQVTRRWSICQGASAGAWQSRGPCCHSRTFCCWTSPPTTWSVLLLRIVAPEAHPSSPSGVCRVQLGHPHAHASI